MLFIAQIVMGNNKKSNLLKQASSTVERQVHVLVVLGSIPRPAPNFNVLTHERRFDYVVNSRKIESIH